MVTMQMQRNRLCHSTHMSPSKLQQTDDCLLPRPGWRSSGLDERQRHPGTCRL